MRAPRRGAALFSAFSAGVFLAVYLLPVGWWPLLGLIALAPAGLCLWRRWEAGTLLCLGLAAALLWCGAFRAVFFAPAEALDGRRTQVTAVLSEAATPTPYGAMVPCWVTGEGRGLVRGTLYAGEELLDLSAGDRVTAVCDCQQTALREETRFDSAATKGVFVTLRARGTLEVAHPERTPWWCLPRQWGQRLAGSITRAFPEDVAGLLTALVTGDKAGMSQEVRTDLARTGMSHLVAVSGMHVCFLVSLLTLFTGYSPRRRCAVCVPVLVFFALAVGASPSVLRACLFQLALLLADLTGREEDRWTTLTGALALLLLLDPFSAANIGLQLSFGAVAGMALVTGRAYARLSRIRFPAGSRWARLDPLLCRVWELIAASLGALCLTVPLSAYYFGTFSLLAPLTNLLVLPVASALFAVTLLLGLLGLFWPAGAAALAAVAAWLGRYVLWVGRSLSAVPYCQITLEGPYYPVALGALLLLGAILLGWRSQRRRLWLFAVCGALVLGGSGLASWVSLRTGTLTLAVLDVGQGQSVALFSAGETALVDCGGNSDDDPGDVCANFLDQRGCRVLDKLILTHYHTDHVCGLDALFRRMEVRELILPRMDQDEDSQLHILALARDEGAKVTWLDRDMEVPLGESRLRVFAPLGDGGANEEGASVLVRSGRFQGLITGDMNTAVERKLVEHARLGRCQVLVAGHHGSRYASGQELLEAIRPESVLISVGENSYGHPAQDTLDRLAQVGAEVYRTDEMGTITVQVN